MNNFFSYIDKTKIIVIARKIPLDKLVRAADAMIKGGIKVLEVTFDADDGNEVTAKKIGALRENFGDALCIGAGTVLDIGQVALAQKAGAEFIISPNTDKAVIAETKRLGMVSIPGALTPSEVVEAYNAGGDLIKIFPANILGADYIRMLKAPLAHIKMVAVGNMDGEKLPSFKAAGADYFAVGGDILNIKWLDEDDYGAIEAEAAKMIALANSTK